MRRHCFSWASHSEGLFLLPQGRESSWKLLEQDAPHKNLRPQERSCQQLLPGTIQKPTWACVFPK